MRPRVVVDPGHGGADPGRVGELKLGPPLYDEGTVWPLSETDVVWPVSVAVRKMLSSRFDVALTRRQPEFKAPGARARYANSIDADLFVSVHCNGFHEERPRGFEIWHYPGSESGHRLAGSILRRFEGRLGKRHSRGLKPSDDWSRRHASRLTVLSRTAMPAVLVELGFLSNPDDLRMLADGTNQGNFAEMIAEGVRDYWETR